MISHLNYLTPLNHTTTDNVLSCVYYDVLGRARGASSETFSYTILPVEKKDVDGFTLCVRIKIHNIITSTTYSIKKIVLL